MDSTTFAWTIASTLITGFQLFLQKVVAQEKRDSAFSCLMMYGTSGALALIVLLWQHTIPSEWVLAAFFGLVAGCVHSVSNFLRIEALKNIDSMLFFPINKVLGPLLVLLGGVLLFADTLSVRQYVGIAFGFSVPLLLFSAAEHHRQNNLRYGLFLVVISTLLSVLSLLLTKHGLQYDSDIFFILVMCQIAGSLSSIGLLFKDNHSFSHITRRDVILGIGVGVLGFISFFTLLEALKGGLVSIVYAIHAHYIIIPIILSVWWYKEHINIRKTLAVVVSFLAIILMYN